MATRLGGVFMKDTDNNIASGSSVSTENICGLVFDTKGFENPLGTDTTAAKTFANGNVVEFRTSNDLKESGITKDIMCGLPYYHISKFFSLAGQNQRLYVTFMNSEEDPEFEAVELLQTAADGAIYQVGVWTAEPTAKNDSEGELVATSLYNTLQAVAEKLGGKIGSVNYDGNSPISIVLNAPIVSALTLDYKKLPTINTLNKPKVTHILGQESDEDDVRPIQLALIQALGGTKMAVVGNVGAALAVLATAPADISIAYVGNYNLGGAISSAELGFGTVTIEDATEAVNYTDYNEYNSANGTELTSEEYDALSASEKIKTPAVAAHFSSDSAFNNMKSITYTNRNDYLHSKGYVFLTPIEGIQGGIFFSSDQTLSTGDYRTISRCRVMHKSRRVVREALLTKVNSPVMLDSDTGYMSSTDITEYQNLVLNALDNNMIEPGSNNSQISGRSCTIDSEQDLLSNDQLEISYSIVPIGCTSAILVTEGFVGSVSE